MDKKIRIGALISGSGTNLQAIIDSCESGKIDGKMIFVGSDNPKAAGLEKSKKHKIDTFVVNYNSIIRRYKQEPEKVTLPADFELNDILSKQNLLFKNTALEKAHDFLITRAVAEAALLEKMKPYHFDLLVLAGFMRNLTPYFIDRVNIDPDNPKIMNIHPALLPAFPGIDGYKDTFQYGCKVGGCTVHFIDYGEDSGPIIGQKAFQIHMNDTLDIIRKKGLELEWELYPECIQLFARGRLKVVRASQSADSNSRFQRAVVNITP